MTDWAHPLTILLTNLEGPFEALCPWNQYTGSLLLTVPHNDTNNGQQETPTCGLLEKKQVNTAGKAVMTGIVPNERIEPKLGSWGPPFPSWFLPIPASQIETARLFQRRTEWWEEHWPQETWVWVCASVLSRSQEPWGKMPHLQIRSKMPYLPGLA